jgi:hypothetical protein
MTAQAITANEKVTKRKSALPWLMSLARHCAGAAAAETAPEPASGGVRPDFSAPNLVTRGMVKLSSDRGKARVPDLLGELVPAVPQGTAGARGGAKKAQLRARGRAGGEFP